MRKEEKLTGRQEEVALLKAEGCSYRQIGQKLGIKEKTVQSHVTAIYSRKGKKGVEVLVEVLADQPCSSWVKPNELDSLTSRELEVLEGIFGSKTNKQIADDLHIGLQTVKNHVSRIISRLGASNRIEAGLILTATRRHSPSKKEREKSESPPSLLDEGIFKFLSKREREILEKLSEGMTNEAIAKSCDSQISVKTVENNLTSLFRKFGVHSRTEVTRLIHSEKEKGLTRESQSQAGLQKHVQVFPDVSST